MFITNWLLTITRVAFYMKGLENKKILINENRFIAFQNILH